MKKFVVMFLIILGTSASLYAQNLFQSIIDQASKAIDQTTKSKTQNNQQAEPTKEQKQQDLINRWERNTAGMTQEQKVQYFRDEQLEIERKRQAEQKIKDDIEYEKDKKESQIYLEKQARENKDPRFVDKVSPKSKVFNPEGKQEIVGNDLYIDGWKITSKTLKTSEATCNLRTIICTYDEVYADNQLVKKATWICGVGFGESLNTAANMWCKQVVQSIQDEERRRQQARQKRR